MKRLFLVGFLVLWAGISIAQPPHWGKDISDERKARIKKRVETMRIWKLTEALSLDEDRAMVFFPRYKAYMAEDDSLKKEVIKSGRKVEEGFKNNEEIDYSAEYKNMKLNIQKMQTLLFDFVESNSDILNEGEMAALLVFEKRFDRALHRMMMDIWKEEGAPPPRSHDDMREPKKGKRNP